ncbi:MAG TPA: hypothetical protein VEU47_18870 [Candidatus Cybelea sp.]|nr:hypothetical protein [Candidatus Cybelea sp.]
MKRSVDLILSLRALADDGATATEIARALGVAVQTIINWAAKELIPLPTRSQARKKAWADPEVRARIKISRRGLKGVLIPKWVPLDLQDEFLDICAVDGEERAASHIRKLKRDMTMAHQEG